MKRVLVALLFLGLPAAVPAGDGVVRKPSRFTVETTLARLEKIVTEKGFSVVARVDHAAGAARVGKTLAPSQVLIFGNPEVGTAIMEVAPGAALDLPIRVAAWEDSAGQVWLTYNAPSWLSRRHDVRERDEVIKRMRGALKKFTDAAVSAGE